MRINKLNFSFIMRSFEMRLFSWFPCSCHSNAENMVYHLAPVEAESSMLMSSVISLWLLCSTTLKIAEPVFHTSSRIYLSIHKGMDFSLTLCHPLTLCISVSTHLPSCVCLNVCMQLFMCAWCWLIDDFSGCGQIPGSVWSTYQRRWKWERDNIPGCYKGTWEAEQLIETILHSHTNGNYSLNHRVNAKWKENMAA